MKVNFVPRDFKRTVSDAGPLMLLNRYFEQNPYLTDDGASLLARPGLTRFVDLGQGPVRGIISEAGSFNGEMFAVSYDTLYRIAHDKTVTAIESGLYNPEYGFVNMAITARIGDGVEATPEYLFLADGRNLYVYIENGYARGNLDGSPANSDQVRIDTVYYQFTSGSVDAGTPDGTAGNPWLVALGTSDAQAFQNFSAAVNADGTEGVQYSTGTAANPVVLSDASYANGARVRARTAGGVGNSIITTETGAGLAWTNGGTLADGGGPTMNTVKMPEDVGAIDVAVIASYVIVIPTQGGDMNGRFYWIEPGETTVNPLNFATAESHPDELYGVLVRGDQFWLSGPTTTEVWYPSGDAAAPMRRMQGIVFNRGTWQQTAVAMEESIMLCDANGAVFNIQGGQPERVSTPDIEQQIRQAIQYQQRFPGI